MENAVVKEIEALEALLRDKTGQRSHTSGERRDHSHSLNHISHLRDTLQQVVERVMGTIEEQVKREMKRSAERKEKITEIEERLREIKRRWEGKETIRVGELNVALL